VKYKNKERIKVRIMDFRKTRIRQKKENVCDLT